VSEQHDGPGPLTQRLNERLAELRAEFDAKIEAERREFEARVAEVEAEVASLEERQDVRLVQLAASVGGVKAEVAGLAGGMREVTTQLGALRARLDTSPTGRAVVGAGAAAGVPSALVLLWEVARFAGWVH
jgi:ABC-type hemin transport system substrate-binding protein